MNHLETKLRKRFENQLEYFNDSTKHWDKYTNLHRMMFSLCTRTIQEAFIKPDRHCGILAGNYNLDQCDDILDFLSDYVYGNQGLMIDEFGRFYETKAIGLLEDEIEEILYIWEALLKTEYVAFQYLCAGEYEDRESFESHLKYCEYLKNQLRKWTK